MAVRALSFSTVAGILTLATAHAADMPLTKNDAVMFVDICPDFGPSFFNIPDPGTCIKLTGKVHDYRALREDVRVRCLEQLGGLERFAVNGRLRLDWHLISQCNLEIADFQPFVAKKRGRAFDANTLTADKVFTQSSGLTGGYAYPFWGFDDNAYGDVILAPEHAQ